ETLAAGELLPPPEQRGDQLMMARDEFVDRSLRQARRAELHAVLLAQALYLPVAEQRQTRQGRQHHGGTEVLIAGAEGLGGAGLVRRGQVVDEALEVSRSAR